MKVRLNVATKVLQTHRRFLVGSGVTAIIAALVFAGLGWHVYKARKADEDLRARTDAVRRERESLLKQRTELENYFHRKDIAELDDRAKFVNGILIARGFNWTQMFMDLEQILPGGVRIISIEPKQKDGHVEVKLTFGASNDEAELKFLHSLEDSKEFKDVRVQSFHNPGQTGNLSGDMKVVQLTTLYSRS
jgi:type IV pilus assembly protein PilN